MSPSIPSKPFLETHGEQIALVRNFDWLDLSALEGIDDEYRGLMADAEYIVTSAVKFWSVHWSTGSRC